MFSKGSEVKSQILLPYIALAISAASAIASIALLAFTASPIT